MLLLKLISNNVARSEVVVQGLFFFIGEGGGGGYRLCHCRICALTFLARLHFKIACQPTSIHVKNSTLLKVCG